MKIKTTIFESLFINAIRECIFISPTDDLKSNIHNLSNYNCYFGVITPNFFFTSSHIPCKLRMTISEEVISLP